MKDQNPEILFAVTLEQIQTIAEEDYGCKLDKEQVEEVANRLSHSIAQDVEDKLRGLVKDEIEAVVGY